MNWRNPWHWVVAAAVIAVVIVILKHIPS